MIKKILFFCISVWFLSALLFFISRLAPGDPLVSYYGERAEKMSVKEREWAEEQLGLDEPIFVQYIRWLENAFHGNFGISYKYKMDVVEVIGARIGNTLILGGIGFVLIFGLAMVLGILCAWYEDRLADRIICQIGTVTSCIPEFWLSLLLILIFAANLRWLPSSGAYAVGEAENIKSRFRRHRRQSVNLRDRVTDALSLLINPSARQQKLIHLRPVFQRRRDDVLRGHIRAQPHRREHIDPFNVAGRPSRIPAQDHPAAPVAGDAV